MGTFITYPENLAELSVDTLVMGLADALVDPGATVQAVGASIDLLESAEIGFIDSSPLYDFRAQRPVVTYVDGIIADMVEPGMALDLVTDVSGHSFLYFHGAEPDFQWPALTQDLLEIIEKFGVTQVFSFHGMPAPVPHTRPADMLIRTTQHVENPSAIAGQASHPASLSDYFEYEAGRAGIKVSNIRVRVPLYMSRSDMPFFSGAIAAVKQLATLGGPTIPLGDLEQHEDQQEIELANIAEHDTEFAGLVAKLEEEYDRSEQSFVQPESTSDIPTSDEIGEAVERFLASQDSSPLDAITPQDKDKQADVPDLRSHIMANLSKVFNRKSTRAEETGESPEACTDGDE